MPFAYYNRLNKHQKAIYRASDKVTRLRLPDPDAARTHSDALAEALGRTDAPAAVQRKAVAKASTRLATEVCVQLGVDPVRIKVLARRPRSAESELHGLYTWEEGCRAEISVWMRTAQRKQVVAFKTFLRTLLHELCHHLDYHMLELADSYHTEGFFKRENSLAHQLMEAPPKAKAPKEPRSKRAETKSGPRWKKAGQLDLF